MGILNNLINKKNVIVNNNSNNEVEIKNVLIATKSFSIGTNGSNILVSNIISPSSLPISKMVYEITANISGDILPSVSVSSNPIEGIFKSFTLRSNPTNKKFFDLDGTKSELSLFQRYMKIDGEFNQSSNLILDNTSSTNTNTLNVSKVWNYESDFSISPEDTEKSGLSLNLQTSTLAEFFNNDANISNIVINISINIYGTYINHNYQSVELIKTPLQITATGIARIGYLMAQGKTILKQYINYGNDTNITDISFSLNAGRNYLFNKKTMASFVSEEQQNYKNSLSINNIPISNQSKLNGVNELFTPIFISSPAVYLDVNFAVLPSVNGYEYDTTTSKIVVNSGQNAVTQEVILYQIVLV